ncbi:MAG TPA: hypothetical protein VFG43_04020 [Geminicoccaceae bacterium]|nr:hypothetical protein [Geminicoccaceae bacterium]
MVSSDRLIKALLTRWAAHACLQDALEAAARAQLASVLDGGELEDFIEHEIGTEQTEYIVEFFWLLQAKGCAAPARMTEWIDRHNSLVEQLQAELEQARQRRLPLGKQHKKRLFRLKYGDAYFRDEAKARCCAHLDGERIVLSLKAIERFMALHMDPGLCKDRLDALVRIGLLEDVLQPNLRLFRSTDRLEAIVAGELEILARALEGAGDAALA